MATLPKLPTRPLGRTGLQVSVLGFGASPLGGVFGPVTDEQAKAAVHRAFELGINFFDTSPYYGATKSEAVLGRSLRGLPRGEVIVCTKVGRYGPNIEDFDFSAERVTRSVHESLARMGLDYIDILHCHDIEFGDLNQVITETIPALVKLREQGLIRFVGVSGLPLSALKRVADGVGQGQLDVILSYCHLTLNDSTLAEAIPYFAARGVGVISASPLSMGLLTPQGPPEWHPAPPPLQAAARAAVSQAAASGLDLPSLALGFSLREEGAATTLVGMSTLEEVEANTRTALHALRLLPSLPGAREAEEALKETFAGVQGLTWPSGRPENNA